MTINTNSIAATSASALNQSRQVLGKSLARLSSSASPPSDSDTGLSISAKLSAQSSRISDASTNVQNAVSYIQTSDGFLSSIQDTLKRMSELIAKSQGATNNSSDAAAYQTEFTALQQQLLQGISGEFNGAPLFASSSSGLSVTTGEEAGSTIDIPATNLETGPMQSVLSQTTPPAFDVTASTSGAGDLLNSAIQQIANERATLSTLQSHLGIASAKLQVGGQNMQSAIPQIHDADAAQDAADFATNSISTQPGNALGAQANQLPQSVLKLL